ncbi:MAG: hypothetical protein QXO70_05140 [Candidatus Pacearchaeota archaeon]
MAKTIEEMHEEKQRLAWSQKKDIKEIAEKKNVSINAANLLNNAVMLITAFPDSWKEKLEDVRKCAVLMDAIKTSNFKIVVGKLEELLAKTKEIESGNEKDDDKQPF